jgi:hypothetical protein
MKWVMVVAPVNADIDETQKIAEKHRDQWMERRHIITVGDL